MRKIIHMDMDAFFASIEQLRRSELKGKPVIVGGSGDPRSRGVVSTASYEARKYGVKSGMPLKTAYRLCPACIFLPVDFETYAKVSQKIKDILTQISPIIEDAGIDEAYLDVSLDAREPVEIAKEIKRLIREATGLTCSVGIGPNKLLSKMAAGLKKPDGLIVLTMKDVPDLIWPLPVRSLIGVGPKTEERLKELGIKTIGELAALSLDRLIKLLGKAFGHYLYEASRGLDESPLVTHWEPKSHGHETTFQKDVDDPEMIRKTLSRLIEMVVAQIKAEGYKGRTVTVKLRFRNFETHTHSITVDQPTNSLKEIKELAYYCLDRFDISMKVRLIGVRVGNLTKKGNITLHQ